MKNNLNPLVCKLNKEVEGAQQDFLLQGKELIGNWLRTANHEGQFEQAVDWLMGNGTDRYFNVNRDVLPVIAIRNAMQLFEIRDSCSTNIYQDARNWFGVK